MRNRRITKCISFVLLLCFMVLELSFVESTLAAEKKDNHSLNYETIVDNNHEYKEKQKEETLDKGKLDESQLISVHSPIFHYIDKTAFDEGKHTKRFEDEEKLNTYVFGNRDGSKTVYYMHENVKYKDEKGNIKDKDISLVKKAEGYGIAQNEVELFLPENPRAGIDVEYSGYTVKIIPQGGNNQIIAKQEADAVIYEKYFDENSSLKYTPLLSGVKEDIILSCYAENVSYDFLLETEKLYMYNDEKGYYLADEANTKPIFYLGEVEVYDAIGKPCMGTMEVSEVEVGKKYMLTLSVDDVFLSDPTTVYPVTIDPTLTISDTATGADSIIDAPIFAGYPSRNYANYKYNTVGTTTASYGIGRTVVKLPGLLNSTEYKNVTSEQIESVKFYVRDSSGTGNQTISLYPLSNTTWTETSVTWNNVGYYYSMGTTATLSSGKVSAFDISSLVWAWKNNKFAPNAGFIMINQTETNNKSFCSSEYSTTSYRPYVVMTYTDDVAVEEPTEISLNKTKESIREGGTLRLTATTDVSGASVTWTSSNTAIATVSSTGLVTGKKAGVTTITAKLANGTADTCTIYVAKADGVYYIQNMNSNLYLNVLTGSIMEGTSVTQSQQYASDADTIKIRQMWKVKYLQDGRYSIRPMHNAGMGLYTGNAVVIRSIGTTDSVSSISTYAQWTIEWDGTGYVFKNNGSDSKTMQIMNASTTSGASIITSGYSAVANCRWNLTKIANPPEGVLLYDTSTGQAISSSFKRILADGQILKYISTEVTAIVYAGDFEVHNIMWSGADESIVWLDEDNGTVWIRKSGEVTITASSDLDSGTKVATYQLEIIPFIDGEYYIRNRQYDRYLQIDNNASSGYSTSGAIMEQWAFDAGDYQKWTLTSLDNGYYKIISTKSGLALSVPSNQTSSEDVSLIQEAYTGAYRQQWKITQTEYGSYKIAPRSSSALVMAVGDSLLVGSDGVNIEQRLYVDNESYKDEWLVNTAESSVVLEEQEETNWCWAACARMASMKYMDSQISQASAAVKVKLGEKTLEPSESQRTNANKTANPDETKEALEYILGSNNVYCTDRRIYSEEVLRSLLDASNPVIIGRGKYDESGNRESGHATIIIGYQWDEVENAYEYEVLDPNMYVSKMRSYQGICNGRNGKSATDIDGYIWEDIVVFKIGNYTDTISWPGVESLK